ncbi:protein smoothened isoform X2 [Anabrus simplex]
MPKCEEDMVYLPSQEMCKMTLSPCRILLANNNWPSFPKCDDISKYPQKCKNDVRELKFNTSGQCQLPLVPTDNSQAFYEGVEGCGVQCESPYFTADEHRQIHQLVAWGGSCCLIFNLFTAVTFFIDWRSANKYPALVIFYINCCCLVSCIGWLAQFTPGARQDIVCRKDGTLRMSEPSAGENLSCVIVFVLVYYFLMAAIVWFVILTYTWHLSFQALGKIQEKIDKKGAYFHLVAWSLPLILTITTMALGEIDGNSVAGICFVGYINHAFRAGFVLGPVFAMLVVGGYFLSRGMITLVRLKITSEEIISERASAKIRETIVRMGLFSLFILVFVIVTFVCHIYEFLHHGEWKESFRNYIICKISASSGISNTDQQCRMEYRPSVAMFQLHLLILFCAGIVMSSWVWTGSTFHTWKRFTRRIFNSKAEEPVRLKKHKVIAQAFAKRKNFNSAGRLSISFHSSHEDPVGLNFDMISVASQDLSSTWAAALPKLMTRRGALIDAATGSISSQRRNSLDSEISYSVRRVSVESRRHSLDSQVSVQIAEVTATRKAGATPLPATQSVRCRQTRNRRRRRDFARYRSCRVGPLFSRRGSSTSQESQLGAQILTALTIGNPNIPSTVPKLMKRREGNAGLDGLKLQLPFVLPGQSLYVSDEGNESDENKIRKSTGKLDIVVCGQGNDIGLLAGNTEYHMSVKENKPCEMSNDKLNVNRIEVQESKCSSGHKINIDRNATDDVKLYHTEEESDDGNENILKKNSSFRSIDVSGLSDSSSYCPELQRLAGSNSGTSVYTHHTLGGGKVRTIAVGPRLLCNDVGVQVNPEEIACQSVMETGNGIELQELKRRPQQYTSQGTQVSPPLNDNSKSQAPLPTALWPKVCRPQALNYSYNVQRLVQELAEGGSAQMYEPPSRPQRRKSKSQSRSDPRSRSVGETLEALS